MTTKVLRKPEIFNKSPHVFPCQPKAARLGGTRRDRTPGRAAGHRPTSEARTHTAFGICVRTLMGVDFCLFP
jgi:hypothetical protein